MTNLFFTHKLLVPANVSEQSAEGCIEEMSGATEFVLTQDEYDYLRAPGGLFEIFDREFRTLIDDCEEDRIESTSIPKAIEVTARYSCSATSPSHAIDTVLSALQLANNRNVFCEISNRPSIG